MDRPKHTYSANRSNDGNGKQLDHHQNFLMLVTQEVILVCAVLPSPFALVVGLVFVSQNLSTLMNTEQQ